jgi:hypothetical protein
VDHGLEGVLEEAVQLDRLRAAHLGEDPLDLGGEGREVRCPLLPRMSCGIVSPMNATTNDGRRVDLNPDALDALRARVRGPVLLPGDDGYEDSRTVWNAMIDRRPAAVVRCLGSADVVSCVQFAGEHDLLLCIKVGGHNIAGLAAADGALMLDMSRMRGVWVDPSARIARAQAGCLLGDVDRETQLHGRAPVLGFVSATGITGLTLGGGFGYLTKRWGGRRTT